MAVMIEPRKEDKDLLASEVAGLSDRLGGLEVKADGLSNRLAGVEVKVGGLEVKVGGLEVKVDGLGNRLTGLEVKVDEGFKHVDERFERVEGELLELRREMKVGFDKLNDRLAYALMAVIGAGATVAAAVLAAPHL